MKKHQLSVIFLALFTLLVSSAFTSASDPIETETSHDQVIEKAEANEEAETTEHKAPLLQESPEGFKAVIFGGGETRGRRCCPPIGND